LFYSSKRKWSWSVTGEVQTNKASVFCWPLVTSH
jgi:hypothetical protein